MEKKYYLNRLLESREFRFDQLVLEDIDNEFVKQIQKKTDFSQQETSLFHQDIANGDDYLDILDTFICQGIKHRQAAPVVRFADGEYAFYANSLKCNGLYKQAESIVAIKNVMPIHVEALSILSRSGKLAPLIFPGNVQQKKKTFFSFLRKSEINDTALKFLDFLFCNNIELSRNSYLPFYLVYAYLTSRKFCEVVDGRKLCIISSECNMDFCCLWFERYHSRPNIIYVEIPDSYVATRWTLIKEEVLKRIPSNTELCLVGAGIGSLLVCVDVAHRLSIPAIDAGHVLNMMNDRVEKSDGARLYTIHKKL